MKRRVTMALFCTTARSESSLSFLHGREFDYVQYACLIGIRYDIENGVVRRGRLSIWKRSSLRALRAS